MDPSFPSPKKLKVGIAWVSSQAGKLPVTTKKHLVLVTALVNKLFLTKEILEFCGALQIYGTDVFEKPVKVEDGAFTVEPTRRQRRQITLYIRNYTSCIQSLVHQGDTLKFVKEKNCEKNPETWLLQCQMKRLDHISCFCYNLLYTVYCRRTDETRPVGHSFTNKNDEVHGVGKLILVIAVTSYALRPPHPLFQTPETDQRRLQRTKIPCHLIFCFTTAINMSPIKIIN